MSSHDIDYKAEDVVSAYISAEASATLGALPKHLGGSDDDQICPCIEVFSEGVVWQRVGGKYSGNATVTMAVVLRTSTDDTSRAAERALRSELRDMFILGPDAKALADELTSSATTAGIAFQAWDVGGIEAENLIAEGGVRESVLRFDLVCCPLAES